MWTMYTKTLYDFEFKNAMAHGYVDSNIPPGSLGTRISSHKYYHWRQFIAINRTINKFYDLIEKINI